jgi:TetR/AcrR family transcriptional regulator, lmrAB and yxaGH operons repressor
VAEAVRFAGQRTAERIRSELALIQDPAKAIQTFIENIAIQVEASNFRSGGPLTTVASESATTNARINQVCQESYTSLHSAFAEKLQAGGIGDGQTDSLAWTIPIEGAIILSRTFHSRDPLSLAASEIGRLIMLYQK